MNKRTLRFPDFPKNPDIREAMVDKAIKNAADLYLSKVITDSQQDFISENWTIMLPIIKDLITAGILQGWELRGIDCSCCPFDQ